MRAHTSVYIIEEVTHAHAQNALLDWFTSSPGLGVAPRPLNEMCWLRIRLLTFVILRAGLTIVSLVSPVTVCCRRVRLTEI